MYNGWKWINSIRDDIGDDVGYDVNDDVRDVVHNITSPFSSKFHEDWLKFGLGVVWIFLMQIFHAFHGILW
jgi:hypothetical protein